MFAFVSNPTDNRWSGWLLLLCLKRLARYRQRLFRIDMRVQNGSHFAILLMTTEERLPGI